MWLTYASAFSTKIGMFRLSAWLKNAFRLLISFAKLHLLNFQSRNISPVLWPGIFAQIDSNVITGINVNSEHLFKFIARSIFLQIIARSIFHSSCLCFHYEIENKLSTFSIKIGYVLTVLNLCFDFARPFFWFSWLMFQLFLFWICSINCWGLQFSKGGFSEQILFSISDLSFIKVGEKLIKLKKKCCDWPMFRLSRPKSVCFDFVLDLKMLLGCWFHSQNCTCSIFKVET